MSVPSPPLHPLSFPYLQSRHACTVSFLPGRDDFHPKRNPACQKLAILPTSRSEDLYTSNSLVGTGVPRRCTVPSSLSNIPLADILIFFIRQAIDRHHPNQHMTTSHPPISQTPCASHNHIPHH